jgi:hypothetical protein
VAAVVRVRVVFAKISFESADLTPGHTPRGERVKARLDRDEGVGRLRAEINQVWSEFIVTRRKPIMKANIQSLMVACAIAFVAFPAANRILGQEMPAPGPEHEALKHFVGKWDAKAKTGGAEFSGAMSYRLECGGLWLVSEFEGEFGGAKFQGRGLDGYDPAKKKYVSVWVDSMSFRPTLFEGEMDTATKTLTMFGEGPGPDGQTMKFKGVTKLRDADHMDFTMFVVGPDGGTTEMMSIEYVRKK